MSPKSYVKQASPKYQAAYKELDAWIKKRLPTAKPIFEWGMPGWKVALPKDKQPVEHRGTYDPTSIMILLADRKAGITMHVWSPLEPQILSKLDKQLTKAGFKVMVGCIQYNRKGDYPVTAVMPLLERLAKGVE